MPFGRLFDGKARRRRRDVDIVYADVVAAAREPWLYGVGNVPDTFDGRFEMMVWHLAFVVRTLRESGDDEHAAFAQELFDGFLDDMDKALREAGVGDIAVPKRLKKMVRVWFGRIRALEPLDPGHVRPDAVEPILKRNLYPDDEAPPPLLPLAGHLAGRWAAVAILGAERIARGTPPYGRSEAAA